MSELLQKPLNKLTHEERLELIELVYKMWIVEDIYNDDFTFLSGIIRGDGHTPLSTWSEEESQSELSEIFESATEKLSKESSVEALIEALLALTTVQRGSYNGPVSSR